MAAKNELLIFMYFVLFSSTNLYFITRRKGLVSLCLGKNILLLSKHLKLRVFQNVNTKKLFFCGVFALCGVTVKIATKNVMYGLFLSASNS